MVNKIAVLIVTYNRLDKLKRSLDAYSNQTILPEMILVVDNNSNDGTVEFLKAWEKEKTKYKRKAIFLDRNLGGSGGFHEGLKFLKSLEYDWIWIADDDAYPYVNAFEVLTSKITENKDYAAICSSVITDEGIDVAHRKISNKFILGSPAPRELYDKERFDISIFSFVGACINKSVINSCGLPIKDFFIWFDDTEFSLRVSEHFKVMCVPAIKVFHDTKIEKEWRYSWKTYYGERNKLYTLQKHMSHREFSKYLWRYRLGMIKHFFCDHRYYLSQKDGYIDFKNGILGVPQNHMPGQYNY